MNKTTTIKNRTYHLLTECKAERRAIHAIYATDSYVFDASIWYADIADGDRRLYLRIGKGQMNYLGCSFDYAGLLEEGFATAHVGFRKGARIYDLWTEKLRAEAKKEADAEDRKDDIRHFEHIFNSGHIGVEITERDGRFLLRFWQDGKCFDINEYGTLKAALEQYREDVQDELDPEDLETIDKAIRDQDSPKVKKPSLFRYITIEGVEVLVDYDLDYDGSVLIDAAKVADIDIWELLSEDTQNRIVDQIGG